VAGEQTSGSDAGAALKAPAAETAGRGVLESFNPATGALVGSVPTLAPEEVQRVVDEVGQVQPIWAALPPADRGRYLRRAAQVILDDIDEIRDLIAREQGKTRTEAIAMEILPTIDALRWCARNGPEILADERIPMPQLFLKTKRSHFVYEPLGVVGVIAPWNYPWTIPLGEIAIALMAGNGVVLKPASLTPLIGERIAQVFAKAGLPEGLVRTVHGGGKVGHALVESTAAKIFFTGSVEVGRGVGESCARAMKGSVLELGGKDPMLVLADAPLENAIAGALWGGFANSGQTCSGIERAYVMREVADRFVAGLVAGARAITVGDPLDWNTQMGPMVSRDQFELVKELVDDAVANGATIECGGPVEVAGLDGAFYAPTVLTGVDHGMRIMKEEIFGPVIPVVTIDSEEEGIALANDSDFGLGASVWTQDRPKGERIARLIESGMVWINDHMYSHGACQCAWGGVKDSGLGRAHSKFGFYECVNVKLVSYEPSLAPNLWWHPYDETLGRALRAFTGLVYGRDSDRRRALKEGGVPLLKLVARTLRKIRRG
jgi:succinate-semialdehyde dehydrogenase/glutarate-semialdehyde dehydrogenase